MTADQPPPPPPPPPSPSPPPPRRYGIGYALASKKQSSFIQPSLVSLARSRGIDLVPIDPSLPLASQGPFDAIIHKLSGEDWESQLRAFSAAHPSVPVVDPPDAIARLHNRASMLQAVSDLQPVASHAGLSFGVPRQAIVLDPAGLADPPAALRYPVIAKPLVADGSACSHKMVLVFRPDGLTRLTPPLVLQEFVNHGGVIFKVYVVDGFVRCVKRKSLPDVSDDERLRRPPEEGSLSFSQVSNMTASADRSEEGYYETMHLEAAEMPPLSFVTEIAHGLRHAMGLRLFNFDVIRDVRAGNHYLVIDINYFPGYAKMPSYEAVLTDFFWDIVHQKQLTDGGTEHASVFVSGDRDQNREPSSSYHCCGVEEKETENVG